MTTDPKPSTQKPLSEPLLIRLKHDIEQTQRDSSTVVISYNLATELAKFLAEEEASKHNEDSMGIEDNWRRAKGIKADRLETNAALANRDYSVPCERGSQPIVIIKGYYIWWCTIHHQPLPWCEKGKILSNALSTNNEALDAVIAQIEALKTNYGISEFKTKKEADEWFSKERVLEILYDAKSEGEKK